MIKNNLSIFDFDENTTLDVAFEKLQKVEYTPYIAAEGASKNHGEPFLRHRAHASIRLNNSQSGSMREIADGFAKNTIFFSLFKIVFVQWIKWRCSAFDLYVTANFGITSMLQIKELLLARFIFRFAVKPPVISSESCKVVLNNPSFAFPGMTLIAPPH
jgi:hypothetical protein